MKPVRKSSTVILVAVLAVLFIASPSVESQDSPAWEHETGVDVGSNAVGLTHYSDNALIVIQEYYHEGDRYHPSFYYWDSVLFNFERNILAPGVDFRRNNHRDTGGNNDDDSNFDWSPRGAMFNRGGRVFTKSYPFVAYRAHVQVVSPDSEGEMIWNFKKADIRDDHPDYGRYLEVQEIVEHDGQYYYFGPCNDLIFRDVYENGRRKSTKNMDPPVVINCDINAVARGETAFIFDFEKSNVWTCDLSDNLEKIRAWEKVNNDVPSSLQEYHSEPACCGSGLLFSDGDNFWMFNMSSSEWNQEGSGYGKVEDLAYVDGTLYGLIPPKIYSTDEISFPSGGIFGGGNDGLGGRISDDVNKLFFEGESQILLPLIALLVIMIAIILYTKRNGKK